MPRTVSTAATWMSLCVSTPGPASWARVSRWREGGGWGMVGRVVRLLMAGGRRAVAGRGGAVRTVTVPCAAGPLSGHARRSGGSTHRLGPQPTDLQQGKRGQLSHGSGRGPKRYQIILTVVTHHVQLDPGVGLGYLLEEGQELAVAVPWVAGIRGDPPGGDLQGSEQGGGAVTLVVVGTALGLVETHR